MIFDESNYLAHYGILRRSGRYPWGSGSTQNARNRSFLDTVAELKKQGMSETKIAEGFGITTSQLRAARTIARNQQRGDQMRMAQALKDKGYSNVAIGERMGINESSVRSLLAPGQKDKQDVLQATANMLKEQVASKNYVDIGRGSETSVLTGISKEKMAAAVALLKEEGYTTHYIKVPQLGTSNFTSVKVLAKPDTPYNEVWKNRDQIKQITNHTDDHGRTWNGLRPPTNLSSKRVAVRYAEDGGTDADGTIYVRPGAKDLDLGGARYAQVRIAVDGTHYLKGMAVYKDDLPAGVDVVFNTNKSNTGNKLDAMKPMQTTADGKIDLQNPFGAAIKLGGQRGAFNIVNEEGDWSTWSKNLPSQMLSKQSPQLAKTQLGVTYERRRKEFEEINSLTNPIVRRKLLEEFSDGTDAASVHLKAAAINGQATQVILPVNAMKTTEIYAPNFKTGDRVALVRFPHGGTFEIPELTVNNRVPEAKKLLGNARDAVGINAKVAERLSGADFDGDTVLVIPNHTGAIKSKPALEGLKGFDPQKYKIKDATPKIKQDRMQYEMGDISNLITDMTIRGANTQELARAVRHSMVVIDSYKHGLDYRASARDNGVAALKQKYQGSAKAGASTLISRATSPERIDARRAARVSEGGPVSKETGKKQYVDTGETYTNKKGQVVKKTIEVPKLANTDDAFSLVSKEGATPIERVYAEHSNKLKALANQARKEAVNTKPPKMSPTSKQTYASEVASLNAQLNRALKNAPLERQAQILANAQVAQRKAAAPDMDAASLKKIQGQALSEARNRVGAKKERIYLTDQEWAAIQSGAISNHKLDLILSNADMDRVRELATPRTAATISSSAMARAKTMLASGKYTQAEVAQQLGVKVTTLMDNVSGGGE